MKLWITTVLLVVFSFYSTLAQCLQLRFDEENRVVLGAREITEMKEILNNPRPYFTASFPSQREIMTFEILSSSNELMSFLNESDVAIELVIDLYDDQLIVLVSSDRKKSINFCLNLKDIT